MNDHSKIDNCLIGWESKVGAWSRLENHCVLGEDVQCKVWGRGVGQGSSSSSWLYQWVGSQDPPCTTHCHHRPTPATTSAFHVLLYPPPPLC